MLQVEASGHPATHEPDEPDFGTIQISLEQVFLNVMVLDTCACAPIREERRRRGVIMDIVVMRIRVVECDWCTSVMLSHFKAADTL